MICHSPKRKTPAHLQVQCPVILLQQNRTHPSRALEHTLAPVQHMDQVQRQRDRWEPGQGLRRLCVTLDPVAWPGLQGEPWLLVQGDADPLEGGGVV